ncbi:hypothetical protein V1511DRAFT_294624 [Dipodascopsis uninucleata]
MAQLWAQLDVLDILILSAVLFGTTAYFTKGSLWSKKGDNAAGSLGHNTSQESMTRDIVEKLNNSDRNMVVFYGSQTGTAEDYASRLAKEGHARFGLRTMIADIEEYDLENLDTFPEDKIIVFVMATYGEGEPTDNASQFYEFITGEDPMFSEADDSEKPLKNLKFVAFGLGNNTYEYYNQVIKNLNESLLKLGATRVGPMGMGDDGAGTMEEDYLSWKEEMWNELTSVMGLQEREVVYEPALKVVEMSEIANDDSTIYLGEHNPASLEGNPIGPYSATNPYIAPVTLAQELFNSDTRNCLQVEFDLTDTNLKYTTGDHIAVWPQNSVSEVDRFLRVFGLLDKRDQVIDVVPIDVTAKVPFPTPTTYDTVVRYRLDISGIVSRQFLATLSQFATDEKVKAELTKLGSEKDYFSSEVSSKMLSIAETIEHIIGKDTSLATVPFTLFIESLGNLQPRYYSISSSSYSDKTKPQITCVVESVDRPSSSSPLKGVASNYLLNMKYFKEGIKNPDPNAVSYQIEGPRGKYMGSKVPVHIRPSSFKLPTNPKVPIIMVGPGTGVAPFRGFVYERAAQFDAGVPVGKSLLFFGCRSHSEDFMYESEWSSLTKKLGNNFELITAFSREGPTKVYVQDKLLEQAKLVNELLENGAYFYVCGDASRMAKDVASTLGKIISQQRDIPEEKGEEIVKIMRTQNQYQEDVWS